MTERVDIALNIGIILFDRDYEEDQKGTGTILISREKEKATPWDHEYIVPLSSIAYIKFKEMKK